MHVSRRVDWSISHEHAYACVRLVCLQLVKIASKAPVKSDIAPSKESPCSHFQLEIPTTYSAWDGKEVEGSAVFGGGGGIEQIVVERGVGRD